MSSVKNNSLEKNNEKKNWSKIKKVFTEKQNKTTEKLENVGWGRRKGKYLYDNIESCMNVCEWQKNKTNGIINIII